MSKEVSMKSETFYCETCEGKRNIYIKVRRAKYKFRKKDFEILESYAECADCGEEIYHEASANQTLAQLSTMYQEKIS